MSTVKSLINGFVGLDGVPILLHEGEERDSEDALVKARPELFTQPDAEPEKPARRVPKDPRGGNG